MRLHCGKNNNGDIRTLNCCCFRVKTILSLLRGNKTGLVAYGAGEIFFCCDVINQWLDVGMARSGEFWS